jgi:dephospho-CoA kinase
MEPREEEKERLKYLVFIGDKDNKAAGTSYYASNSEALVRFFNNYNYTVYVPTEEQIEAAKAKGLMTWKEIEKWVSDKTNKYENELSDEDKAKAQTMITVLVNFVKYHFQDQSLFVDNVTNNRQYQTSCIDNVTNSYLSLGVEQSPSALSVVDRFGNKVSVTDSEANRNLLARDICYDSGYSSADLVKNSSYAVIHQLNGYLNFNAKEDYDGLCLDGDETKKMPYGNFDFWNYAKPEQLNSYVAKYRLR